ncbi:MAG: GatB/YqeY domain-containing protein [Myxococcales bacterium]|jgi:uncharacterized protein YqeY|nr:GatB/YqeY domain-containing protein [Myxococcales bacterium]
MSLKQRLADDLKAAMKARDEAALSALRLLKSAITNREIELKRDVDESELVKLVEKALKQRRESMEVYRQAGRVELAEREEAEAQVLGRYLPEQLTPEALAALIDEALREVNATSPQQMGLAMKAALAKVGARADGKAVSALVKQKLS